MKITFLFSILLLSLTSCSTYYSSANFSNETSPYIKPTYRDTIEKATYITSAFSKGKPSPSNTFENLTFGSVAFHKAETKKNISIAYGGFVHAGEINFNKKSLEDFNFSYEDFETEEIIEATTLPTNKYYFGGGASAEIDINIPFKYVDWRILGLKSTLTYETGTYLPFRQELVRKFRKSEQYYNDGPFFYKDIDNTAYDGFTINLSLTSGVVLKLKNSDIGWVSSAGFGSQVLTASTSFYYSQNKFTGFLGWHGSFQGTIFSAGIAYRLK